MSGSLFFVPSFGLYSFCWFTSFNFDVMDLFYLTIFYFAILCCYLLETCSSLMRDKKRGDSDKRGCREELE